MTTNNLAESMAFATAMRSIMENSTDCILICDAAARPVFFNRAYAEIMKKSLGIDLVPGQAPQTQQCDHETTGWWDANHARVLSGETFSIEYTQHFQDEGIRHFEFNYTPIRENGTVQGFIKLSRDITDRRQTETLLRQRTELLETILENIPVMIALADPSGTPQWINSCFEKTLSCPPDRITSPGIWEELYPDPQYRQRVLDYIAASDKTWGDFKTLSLDGRVLDTLWTNVPLQDGSKIGIGIDITERRQTEAHLADRESLLASLANTVEDSIFCKDSKRRYTFVNRAMANMFGCTEADLLGKTPEELFDPASAAKINEVDDRTFSGQRVNEIRRLNVGGRPYFFHTVQMPMTMQDGTVTSINGIVRDVTQSIRDQEEKFTLETKLRQAVKMQAVGTMAGGIAHEFNNLLSVIMGCTELARTELSDGSFARDQLNNVLKASHKVKDLVKQILTFSRQGQQQKRPGNLAALIREGMKLVRPSIPASIDIGLSIDSENGTANVDPTEIQQILMNLFSNAVWAMNEKGSIRISLHDVRLEGSKAGEVGLQDGSYTELVFADTGMGMDDETKNKIFDPFFTRKPVGEGTGMGLSIVHGIMKSYGGAITVDSTPGAGTAFHLFFPLTQEAAVKERKPKEELVGGSERILFVDDQQMVAEMSEKVISHLGYSVDLFTDSRKALDAFRANPDRFDLVITDQIMPGLSGEELAQHICAVRPNMPIILCTGYSSQIDEGKAKALGIKAFAYKPIGLKNIARLIRKVLDDS